MIITRSIAALLLVLGLTQVACAQGRFFPAPDGGSVPLQIMGCVDDNGKAVAVRVTENPCPAGSGGGGGGDASAANQVTGNNSLSSIDTKTPALGQAAAAASVPVILPSATITTLTPPAAITGFGTAANQTTIIGHVDGLETAIASTNTKLDTLNTNVTAAIPAGTAIIGKVGIDQATPGTTNLVAITPAHAGAGATGAAPPANANYMGALSGSTTGGLTTGLIACDSTAIYDASTTGSTELVALASGKSIYVCGYSIIAGGTVNVKLITGTGTACATGSSNKTPAFQLTAQAGIADGAPFFRGLKTASGGALCINASGAVAAQAIVYYAQF